MVQNGSTSLMRACYVLDIVKLLIRHGAHLNDKDYVSLKIIIQLESLLVCGMFQVGDTALIWASEYDNMDVETFLIGLSQ